MISLYVYIHLRITRDNNLNTLPALTDILLQNNNINSVQSITSLINNKTLKRINLASNELRDNDMVHIAKLLELNNKLQTFLDSYNPPKTNNKY